MTLRSSLTLVFLFAAVGAGHAQEPRVTASFGATGRVATDEALTLTLVRSALAEEGRLAVLVGATDMTSLFEQRGDSLRFEPRTLPLPAGKLELSVHRVSPGGAWTELARFPLEVVSPRAFERARVALTADLALKAQLAEGHAPFDNAPARATFRDVTAQLGLASDHARGGLALKASAKLLGVTFQNEALRFSALRDDAPRLDLAGYTAELQAGQATFRLGDLAYGSHRHLMQNFASRGTSLRLGLGPAADVSVAAAAGSKLVGWDNVLGIDTSEHRLLAATLGLELVPAHPGRLRVEASLLHGSVLPVASYNQGLVNDAAESDGLGLRLVAAEPAQRLRVDGGFSRTRYTNPLDPLLQPVVAVEEETAQARYADLRFDLLRNTALVGGRDLTLTLNWLHERVDPLYGSAGVAQLARDQLHNTFGASAVAGELLAQYAYGRSEDNLDEVPSILKTFTRRHTLDVTLPLSAFAPADAPPSPWLPLLTYNFGRVTQVGAGLPQGSGFAASHVPDQQNDTHAASLGWQGSRASFGYRLDYSKQDNRQPGREDADFTARVQTLTLGVFPGARFDANLDLGFERNEALERAEVQKLTRLGLGANGRLPRGFGFTGLVSWTRDEDEAGTNESSAAEMDVQLSWRRVLRRGERQKPLLTLFARYARQRARLRDLVFLQDDERKSWQFSTGVNLSAF